MLRTTSLPQLRGLMGKDVASFPGSPPSGALEGPPSHEDLAEVKTLKQLIEMKTKGSVGAPYATRERPVAGLDIADVGGAYSSYSAMMVHRIRHTRTLYGPNERFGHAHAPPITSYNHGFGEQKVRPPMYPISSTNISRVYSEIQKTLGKSKGR